MLTSKKSEFNRSRDSYLIIQLNKEKIMKIRITVHAALIVVSLLFYAQSSYAQKEKTPWETIFNGKNLDGWKMVGDKGVAYVKDGEIVIHRVAGTKEHTFVTTKKKYSDFILEVDFKMDEPGISTGVLIRCVDADSNPDTSKVRLYGYQIKIDNSPRNWTGGVFDDFGGTWKWMYDLTQNEPARQAFKIWDWNTFRIEAIGNTIKVWVNGVPSTNLISDKYSKGYIALKIHSLKPDEKGEEVLVHFKNIRILTKNLAAHVTPSGIQQMK